jgi:hypothetical protein
MKNTLSLLVVLLVGSATFANSPDIPKTNMAVLKNGTTIKLLYKGDQQSDVRVSIFNDENQVVFTEKIKNTNGFSRPYNFSELPEGNYSIRLIDNAGIAVEKVVVEKKAEQEKIMHLLRLPGTNKLLLSIPNNGAQDIYVTIYNQTNEVLYEGGQSIQGDFAQVYNLEKYEGSFTFVVSDNKGLSNTMTK